MLEYIRILPVKRIRIRVGTETFVDSTRGMVLYEGIQPPRYYVPREDVKAALADGVDVALCQHKGRWKGLDVTVGDRKISGAAWTIYDPARATEAVKDFVAFHANKVDALVVD
ncbi:MAG: DUF427 domain-containing protein [Deltaproteobacteria bacterium]|nr:DUF427 domain-containing protein [Deltaproteobacteria bacterium]